MEADHLKLFQCAVSAYEATVASTKRQLVNHRITQPIRHDTEIQCRVA
jgi:hypothetical protein